MSGSGAARAAAERISAELAVAMARPERVAEEAREIREAISRGEDPEEALDLLTGALSKAAGPAVLPAAEILAEISRTTRDPDAAIAALLRARDPEAVRLGLAVARELAAEGLREPGVAEAVALASRLDADSPDDLLRVSRDCFGEPRLRELFLAAEDPAVRGLAGRLLDLRGEPASAEIASAALGARAAGELAPYLEYTRASHADLAALVSAGAGAHALAGIREAVEVLGPAGARELAASAGWPRLSLGARCVPFTAMRPEGSIPFFVRGGAGGGPPSVAVLAHGGSLAEGGGASRAEPLVARFRAANLVHAEALRDLIDVGPLDRDRLSRLVSLTDRIVGDYVAVFAAIDDACPEIEEVWRALRGRILDEARGGEPPFSAETTRLVLAFEDPGHPGAVRSLHGLKRFLHQRGLRLGFRLMHAGTATDRTVDVLLFERGRLAGRAETIRYADFEPAPRDVAVPRAVRVLAEGFVSGLLHGRRSFPAARVYCYGNEVHHYLSYGTHPALLRIDWSPPARGGMIDLEFFGVSRYDLDQHPARDLEALRAVFARLDFTVTIDPTTRVHARYDKERARDLGDLVDRAGSLFRLLPYLMDLDWTIGDLDLPPESKREVARAWAEIFARRSAIPYDLLLTTDRRGILAGIVEGPEGTREIRWSGDPPYRDRFPETADVPASAEREEGPHPGEIFARLLSGPAEPLADAARLASVVAPVERTLRLVDVGAVEGNSVSSVRVPLLEGSFRLHVLRGPRGLVRLAATSPPKPAARVVELLRAAGYEPSAPDPEVDRRAVEDLRERLSRPGLVGRARPLPGERRIPGVAAAPGRASGRARLTTARRAPVELDGAILVVPTLRPEEGPLLARAAGVLATAGATLSHAGFVAAQWRKPAIVAPGAWSDGGARVAFAVEICDEDELRVEGLAVTSRRAVGSTTIEVEEGDVLVVESDAEVVRVLGRDADAIALHEALRAVDLAAARLARVTDPAEVLAARGDAVRSRHRAVAVLSRLDAPVLADHAVREIVLGAPGKGELLRDLLANPRVGPVARATARRLAAELARRHRECREEAERRIPSAGSLHEVLALRAAALRLDRALRATGDALASCGLTEWTGPPPDDGGLDRAARRRLEELLAGEAQAEDDPHARLSRERIATILGEPGEAAARAPRAPGLERVLLPDAIGLDDVAAVGGKAANLAELGRRLGPERVPAWFAVADAAFRETLHLPGSAGRPLGEAIEEAIGREGRDARSRASEVRALFESARLPEEVAEEIVAAYRALGGDVPVAVRSSAAEEDAEDEAHAGTFDTFLGVRGERALLAHVKKAWAGLWNERALARGAPSAAGGGVIVQRLVDARVSGVAQTINASSDEPGEIVVEAGLGLGEGVVSGAVAADRVIVAKEGDLTRGPLRFRYEVADKRERVVADAASGRTRRVESLYHQRLRPALEYVELLEVVAAAHALERTYRRPIDLEFAFEGERLRILQVRPLPAHAALVRETLERFPLPRRTP